MEGSLIGMERMKLASRDPVIGGRIIADNGEVLDKTGGPVGGYEVFAKVKDWDHAVRCPGTDHLLYVLDTDGTLVPLVPLPEYERTHPELI